MKNKLIFSAIIIIFLSGVPFFSYKVYTKYQNIKRQKVLLETKKQEWLNLKNNLGNKVMSFNGTVAVVIKDLNNNWEIAFNKDKLIPSASLVKIPIMLSCFEAAQEGKISLNDALKPGSYDKLTASVFTPEELFEPMITRSDNAAANALIDYLGFDTLNDYFKKMGLKNTNISRKMLDFKERKEGVENYTNAQDMAYLLEELYRNNFLSPQVSEKCLALLGGQKINDRIPKKLPKDGVFVAHKTGLERHVCHDVGIVFTNKGDFIICVLVKHENKFAKPAKKLISDIALTTFNYYQNL